MKKIISLLLALTLMVGQALAWGDVVDNADILTDEQEAQLTARINELRRNNGQDFAFLSTDDFICFDPVEFGAFYWDQNGFGLGLDHSGVLVYLDMNIQMMVIITSGQATNSIPDESVDLILDAAMPFLQNGDYCGAALLALNMAEEYILEQ